MQTDRRSIVKLSVFSLLIMFLTASFFYVASIKLTTAEVIILLLMLLFVLSPLVLALLIPRERIAFAFSCVFFVNLVIAPFLLLISEAIMKHGITKAMIDILLFFSLTYFSILVFSFLFCLVMQKEE